MYSTDPKAFKELTCGDGQRKSRSYDSSPQLPPHAQLEYQTVIKVVLQVSLTPDEYWWHFWVLNIAEVGRPSNHLHAAGEGFLSPVNVGWGAGHLGNCTAPGFQHHCSVREGGWEDVDVINRKYMSAFMLPCDAALAAVQKHALDWLHVSRRNHVIAFTLHSCHMLLMGGNWPRTPKKSMETMTSQLLRIAGQLVKLPVMQPLISDQATHYHSSHTVLCTLAHTSFHVKQPITHYSNLHNHPAHCVRWSIKSCNPARQKGESLGIDGYCRWVPIIWRFILNVFLYVM